MAGVVRRNAEGLARSAYAVGMRYPVYQVDAFADAAFTGNPAAVVLVDGAGWPGSGWMQSVAAEMNLSETAFVTRPGAGEAFGLRWFTPEAEVELCGHATLASAHVLWERGEVEAGAAVGFDTVYSGRLTCRRGAGGWIAMDFPADPATETAPPEGLVETLGVEPTAVARSRYDWLVEAGDASAVRAVEPDFSALRRFETRGIIVTARGDGAGDAGAEEAVDFVSRFFAPRLRVDEDPVTGSAHCVLGPWWAARLGCTELTGYQASRRGGRVGVEIRGDRVTLSGRAVTVMRGALSG